MLDNPALKDLVGKKGDGRGQSSFGLMESKSEL